MRNGSIRVGRHFAALIEKIENREVGLLGLKKTKNGLHVSRSERRVGGHLPVGRVHLLKLEDTCSDDLANRESLEVVNVHCEVTSRLMRNAGFREAR